MEYYKISIGMVNSRDNEFVEACKRSIDRQIYLPNHIEFIEIDNKDKKKSIGKCYNEIAEKAKYDWILFIGDDDMICRPYLFNLSVFLDNMMEKTTKEIVAVTTNITLIDENTNGNMVSLDAVPQGMWNRKFLLKNPFNEKLPRYIDADMFERVEKMGKFIAHDQTNAGYLYRQHTDNISGNKFKRKGGIAKIMKERIKLNKVYGV